MAIVEDYCHTARIFRQGDLIRTEYVKSYAEHVVLGLPRAPVRPTLPKPCPFDLCSPGINFIDESVPPASRTNVVSETRISGVMLGRLEDTKRVEAGARVCANIDAPTPVLSMSGLVRENGAKVIVHDLLKIMFCWVFASSVH
jgi:hypothetical protein